MSEFGHSTQQAARQFAAAHSIDTRPDTERLGWNLAPLTRHRSQVRLVQFDAGGTTEKPVNENGAEYKFAQMDYFTDGRLAASRMIAKIFANRRTELAYWTERAPKKQMTVHQGRGTMAVGDPADGSVNLFKLDADITPRITLPHGRFYTLQADPWTTDRPLVVSGFYPQVISWSAVEIPFEPGQETVEAPEGTIQVPKVFHDIFRRYASS